jgi:Cu/Ag efflux protein CusF
MKEQTVSVTATVEAIDLPNRVVTLKGPKGNVFDLKVGEEAKNLPQVKVGDLVNVNYYESLAFQVTKPGQASTVQATSAVARAKPGEKPGGTVANQVTVTATVQAIDAKTRMVTLKGPEGKTKEIKVKDPKNLKNVKVGDEVVFTYTEALAVSVEPAKKK